MRLWYGWPMSLKARLYLVVVAVASVYVVAAGLPNLDFPRYLFALVLLSAASFFSQVYELEVIPHYTISTQTALALAAIYIGGLELVVWVTILSSLPAELVLRWDKLKTDRTRFVELVLFNTAQMLISVAIAAHVFAAITALDTASVFGTGAVLEGDYVAMIGAFLAYMLVNHSLVAGIISLSSEGRFLTVLRFGLRNLPLQFITMGVLAILISTLYDSAPHNLILVFVPLALVHYSVRSYLRLRRDSHQAFKRITDLLAHRDEYTGEHSDDVEELAAELASAFDLSDEKIEVVRVGAAIHDIGKIAIPDAILNKLGALEPEEFETMKTHTTIGADIVSNLDIYRDVVPIVRHEHEHWDGSGYPDGLVGESIPLEARIVAVADVYSALTTERAYRPPKGLPLKYSLEEACAILRDMADRILDPTLVEVFIERVLASGRKRDEGGA